MDGVEKIFTKEVDIKDAINIDFTFTNAASFFPAVTISIDNQTEGVGLSYLWTFDDGMPATFEGKDPPQVVFTTPGQHNITLEVFNGFETQSETQTITVLPNLASDFSWTPNFEDDDFQAPVTLNFSNESISATSYEWTFPGGNPSTSTAVNPTVTFSNPGTYAVSLKAINDKTQQNKVHQITILPNSNLRLYQNVKFGVNSAHNANAIGAFFSTTTRQSYTANQASVSSSLIDIAFQGLNSTFIFNKFISPNEVQNFGFLPLNNAQSSIFINSQELCNCGLNFTVAQFDAMQNDLPLQSLNINQSPAGAQEFNSAILPRIVLFKLQDGRKGAIKVKSFVSEGTSSYLKCDIKVQKQ